MGGGIGAPAHTPQEIIAILNTAVNATLDDASFKARLADLGAEPFVSSSTEFRKFIADETEKWAKVIRTAGIKAVTRLSCEAYVCCGVKMRNARSEYLGACLPQLGL